MSIIYNENNIQNVKYNDIDLDKVIYNDTIVYQKLQPSSATIACNAAYAWTTCALIGGGATGGTEWSYSREDMNGDLLSWISRGAGVIIKKDCKLNITGSFYCNALDSDIAFLIYIFKMVQILEL